MDFFNIMNSDYKRVAKKVLEEQSKSNRKTIMVSKAQQVAQEIEMKIENVESTSKYRWKEQVNEKI